MPDWLGSKGFKNQPIPKICSHLANGAKHFKPYGKHTAVSKAERRDGWIEEGWVEEGWIELAKLVVILDTNEASALGKSEISVLELAELTLAFWEGHVARL